MKKVKNKIKTILIEGNPFQYVPVSGSDGSEFKQGDIALNGRGKYGSLWLVAFYKSGNPKSYSSWNPTQLINGFNADKMRQANITAFTNGKPLPYTKQQHTEAQGFSNEDAKCWNKYLPEAEQYIEIPDNYLFVAFGIANVPDVCIEQLEALHNKMEADKWTVKGKEIKNWRKELLPEIEKLDRVKHTIYTLPMHQTIQLPEIRKQVTRVAHGLIYEGTGVGSALENSIYVPVKGEFYNVDYNYPDMINLIELEKQRIKNKGV